MHRKLSLIVTLFAWLFATGSHWDLVQTFAWGKMFSQYAQTMSWTDAVRMTFTAENFCGVCEIVDDARADADTSNPPGQSGVKKIDLGIGTPSAVILQRPEVLAWVVGGQDRYRKHGSAPPLPPPRA